jgi:hypothetical protein
MNNNILILKLHILIKRFVKISGNNTLMFFLSLASCKNDSSSKHDPIADSFKNMKSTDTANAYNFSDFKVGIFNGKKVRVDFKNDSLARQYWVSFLPPTNSSTLAFAGHFAIVEWQHPSNSVGGLMIDLVSGKTYELPKCTLGYSYTKNSKLIILNPPNKNGQVISCYSCETQYWVWNDSTKVFSILNK